MNFVPVSLYFPVKTYKRFVASSVGLMGYLTFAAMVLACASAQAQTKFGSQNVGVPSPPVSVEVVARVAGVASVQVLTWGASGLDFTIGSGTSNCASANLAVNQTCTESISFTPQAPGQRIGAVVLLDSNNNVLGTTYLSGWGVGALGVFVPGTMQTVAGSGDWKSVLDHGPATSADLDLPSSVVLDGYGNMFIADSAHQRIRKVTAATGEIDTIAGNGNPSYSGDNGLALNATLNTPTGVALDGAGNLYIADSGNNVIRKIWAATGLITTVAGTGQAGSGGDNGPATSATLSGSLGISIAPDGSLFIADTANHRIRKVDALTGIITNFAGNGSSEANGSGTYGGDGALAVDAGLNYPYSIALDAAGNVFIPDSGNNRIRKVDAVTGNISTFAGTGVQGYTGDGSPAISATLYAPVALAFDPAGNLYVSDTQNNCIREISANSGNNISTAAGNGTGGYYGDTGSAKQAGLYGPYGLFMDGNGNLFIADYFDQRIREIQRNLAVEDFAAEIRQGDVSNPQLQYIENDGNISLALNAITPETNAAVDGTTTTCLVGIENSLGVNSDCAIGAEFAPTVSGPLHAQIQITGNTNNSPLVIEVIGVGTAVNSTTVTLVSSPNPSTFGSPVGFTASVVTGAKTGPLTGTVTFSDGIQSWSSYPLKAGIASFSTPSLTVGLHAMTASYSGDPLHFSSTSVPLPQIVNEVTAVMLSSNNSTAEVGSAVTFTATITTPYGGAVLPDGAVTFKDGTLVLGPGVLGSGSTWTYTTAALTNGIHSITAAYGGDAAEYILASTSAVLNQGIQAPTSATITSSGPTSYGLPVIFTAIITPEGSVPPSGLVKFLDGEVQIGSVTLADTTGVARLTLSTLAPGQHEITAFYPGGLDTGSSTSPAITQVVNQASTATALAAAPNVGIAGKALQLTAKVSVVLGVNSPGGTVSFSDGNTSLGKATLGFGGTASISPTLAAGVHSVVAAYSGDINDSGSASSALPLTVQLATTTVAVTPSLNPAPVLTKLNFTANVTGNGGVPGGSVNFLVDDKSIGTSTLDSTGAAVLAYAGLAVGSHNIAVTYTGDSNDLPGVSAGVVEVIQSIPTVTALGTTSTGPTALQVALVATVIGATGPPPTGAVTFYRGSTVIGQGALDATGVATLTPNLPAGTYRVDAVYSGDAVHGASTSAVTSFSTIAIDFNLAATPNSLTLATTQNGTITISIASASSSAETIGLGCGSLPAMVTCHFSSSTVDLKAGSVQKVQLTIDTNSPIGGGTTAMQQKSGTNTHLAGIFLPLAGLFGFVLWRYRKRNYAILMAVLLFVLTSASMFTAGCGGFTKNSAAPGTYVIQVNGVGASSNVARYDNITLVITK